MRRNASVHRQDLSLYSHLKEYLGNGVRTHVNSKGKIPSTRSSEDQTHEAASHRAASPTHYDWAILAPKQGLHRSASYSPCALITVQVYASSPSSQGLSWLQFCTAAPMLKTLCWTYVPVPLNFSVFYDIPKHQNFHTVSVSAQNGMERPYMLCPDSPQSPLGCPQNSANSCPVKHRGWNVGRFLSQLIFPSGDHCCDALAQQQAPGDFKVFKIKNWTQLIQ